MKRLCNECDEPIPAKRLLAVPNARFCVGCQQRHDVRLRAEWPATDEDEFNAAGFILTQAPSAQTVVERAAE